MKTIIIVALAVVAVSSVQALVPTFPTTGTVGTCLNGITQTCGIGDITQTNPQIVTNVCGVVCNFIKELLVNVNFTNVAATVWAPKISFCLAFLFDAMTALGAC